MRCDDCGERVVTVLLVNAAARVVDVLELDPTPAPGGPYRLRWFLRWNGVRRFAVRRIEWIEACEGRAFAWREHACVSYQPSRSPSSDANLATSSPSSPGANVGSRSTT